MKAKPTNKELFVTDISFDVEEEDLRKLFSVCGTVRTIHLLTDKRSGKFNGCAFVKMTTAAEAKDAVNMLDGARLINRCITVRAAEPKKAADPIVPIVEKTRRPTRPRGRRK